MRKILIPLVIGLWPGLASSADLIMVEEQGCYWCGVWNSEIGPIYPKTKEGAFAPLTKVDIDAAPSQYKFAKRLAYTPTFVLVENGVELARIEGYPGEDFFWPMLEQMLKANTEFEGDS